MKSSSTILSKVQWHHELRWMGIGPSQSVADKAIKQIVKSMWDSGELPEKLRDGVWIAGYEVTKSFAYVSATPITVGPLPPSHYRDRYAKITIDNGVNHVSGFF
ncbi:hypothetical protein [Ralstonia phage RP13]|nr:hypothetical protein [Ralstonia phage RP13]